MNNRYYRTDKNYYYKITNKGKKTRISVGEYKKATQKKGGEPPLTPSNNSNINNQVKDKRVNILYKILSKIFPEEIVDKFVSECGKDGFYKSKLKICYNNKEKIITNKLNNDLSIINRNKFENKIEILFKTIEDWKTYSSTISGHLSYCNSVFTRKNNRQSINWILKEYIYPEIPTSKNIPIPLQTQEKIDKYNELFTTEIKNIYEKFFKIFKGLKIKYYCRRTYINKELNYTNPLRFCYVVEHPNGFIMSLQEFGNLFSNNFEYISDEAVYIYNKKNERYISKYPFAGMTYYMNNGKLTKYYYNFEGNNDNFNDDDIYQYNLTLFRNSQNI